MVRPADYRRAVGYLQAEHQMSERRACRALGFCRASAQDQPRREVPVELIAKLRELATRRPRWGYRLVPRTSKRTASRMFSARLGGSGLASARPCRERRPQAAGVAARLVGDRGMNPDRQHDESLGRARAEGRQGPPAKPLAVVRGAEPGRSDRSVARWANAGLHA